MRSKSKCSNEMNELEEVLTCVSEALLSRFRKRSPRYGPNPQRTIEWIPFVVSPWTDNTLLQMNGYLLDDTLPSGSACCYRRRSPPTCTISSGCIREIVQSVTEYAVRLRLGQYLEDGNHRTSILVVFELLALHGIQCEADAVTLYILISNRCQTEWKSRTARLSHYIYKNSRVRSVSINRRHQVAKEVKALWRWNSFFDNLNKLYFDYTFSRGEQRLVLQKQLRAVKKKNIKRYKQWLWLFRETE